MARAPMASALPGDRAERHGTKRNSAGIAAPLESNSGLVALVMVAFRGIER